MVSVRVCAATLVVSSLFLALPGWGGDRLEFETSEPELIPQADWAPGLLSREQYADFAEDARGQDHMVVIDEDPQTAQPLVGYGMNFVFGGLNRGFAVFGTEEAGYRLYADVDADGSLADEEGWSLTREDNRYVHPFETMDEGQSEGRPVAFPIKSQFVIYPGAGEEENGPRGIWNSRTVRRGEIRLGERTVPFELYGHSGHYDYRNQTVWFDLDGDGKGGESRQSPERFRNLDEFVNIGEQSYAFDVDPFGRHLNLVAEEELRSERPPLQPGEPAPTFEATALDGDSVGLGGDDGFVMLYFWAHWCGPCRTEAPRLAGIHERWGGEGLQVIGITTDSEDEIEAFTSEFGHDWPQVSEAFSGPVHRAYRVGSYPTKYLVDSDGDLVCGGPGSSFWEDCWPEVETRLKASAE